MMDDASYIRAYKKILSYARIWSFFSKVVACIGFLVILGGLVTMLFTKEIVDGLIAATSGIAIYFTSGLLFRQAVDASKQANSIFISLMLSASR